MKLQNLFEIKIINYKIQMVSGTVNSSVQSSIQRKNS